MGQTFTLHFKWFRKRIGRFLLSEFLSTEHATGPCTLKKSNCTGERETFSKYNNKKIEFDVVLHHSFGLFTKNVDDLHLLILNREKKTITKKKKEIQSFVKTGTLYTDSQIECVNV